MEENQVLENAKQMFLHNAGRKDVIDYLMKNGVSADKVETMATEAAKAVRGQKRELEQAMEAEEKSNIGSSVLIGILFLVGGIVATMMTDRIWYGAMGVGVITILSGLFRSK